MDVNSAPRGELVRLIYEMVDKIALLEGGVARLKEKLHEKGKDDGSSSNTKPNDPIRYRYEATKQ